MEYILSLSYGKDSLACLGAIEHLGWPLDRIVHAEVWATEKIPADLPPIVEFKKKTDAIIKERWGIEVEHICAKNVDGVKKDRVTYEDVFYHKMTRGKFVGTIKGFPQTIGQWCQKLKLNAMEQIASREDIQYLGIAADEPKRIRKHIGRNNVLLPLYEIGWHEDYCGLWSQYNNLLSPAYTDSFRSGCWFCHNQGVHQLRHLRRNYPEYWALLLKWDQDSPVSFKPDGYTVHDYEKRFALEDEGFIDPNARWEWAYLKDKPIQIKISV